MAYKITDVKEVQKKAKGHRVEYLGYRDQYKVTSIKSGRLYVVSANINRCTCERQKYIGRERNNMTNACSHVQAVMAYKNNDYQLVARQTNEDVSHLHRKTFNELAADGVVMTGRKI